MGPGSLNLRAVFRRTARRALARFGHGFPTGIAARLATSFAAVAILAAAANLIIEHGVAVVQTTRLDRGQFSPIPASIKPVPIKDDTAAIKRHTDTAVALDRIDHFIGAVDRLELAIQVRTSIDSSSATDEVHAARNDLDTAAAVMQREPWSQQSAAANQIGTKLSSYEQAGANYLQFVDARRTALHEYMSRLDAIDGRITASLDGAWKFFGRVFARQSLMQLHNDLDELRRRFARIGASDGYDAGAVESIASSELAFAATVNRQEGSFSRSEGVDWVHQMREDISRIVALRESIVAGDMQSRGSAAKFAAARTQLIAAIPKPQSDPVSRPAANPHPLQTPATLPPAIASPVIDAVTTTTTTVTDDKRRVAVACITAAVLAVLLMISVLTVRSILIPVSRMLEATRNLANGNAAVRVPRGGLKELDTLAAAFNRMAAQLAAARDMTQDYRQHLETQVEQRTRQLQYLAEHDSLTMLPNRRQFFILLNQSLRQAAQTRRNVAVFYIDLDNFKNLNDGMGHAFGDRVLMSVAHRLEEASSSFGFAARLGGDEFTVVYEDAWSTQVAYEAGRKLVEAFQRPLTVDARDVTVSVSIGASMFPDHGERAEDLLSAADAALFRAKALGRSQLAIFTPELLETATRKFTTEQGLRRALERSEFELVFQPEVSLDSLEVGLVEALIRWRLPDGRLATPDEFLAVTEESGLIIELGYWVLRNAIQTASTWYHGLWPDVRIAINVSPRQLLDLSFVERVQDLLREFRLPPQCIEFELTESVLQTGPGTIESLRLLRSFGIAIALDDFGTGYSSLASLEQLPLSRIKLDRTLIAGIDINARSAAIAAALIKLCDGLGIEVTAEGVERASQFGYLAGHRAMYVQGYLISRPVAASEVLRINSLMPQIMHDLLLSIPARHSQNDKSERDNRRSARQELTSDATKL